MSKKEKEEIVINGKTYVAKGEEAEETTPEGAGEAAPEETGTEAPAATGDEAVLEKALDSFAEKFVAKMGLPDLNKRMSEIEAKITPGKAAETKVSALMDLEKLMKKDVSQMTAKEKIVGFFQAMLQNNEPVLKALSEGSNTDGGYLFPPEFRSEIIRDILEQIHLRNEVTVIPMKRDVMNIPTLASGPQITWTQENAAKSTTTAHFGQAQLVVKKMAAILYASDELIEDSDQIDIVQFIIQLFSERIGNEEDRVISVGNGTTEPSGFDGATLTEVDCAGSNLNFDKIIDLEYSLPMRYLANAKFMVNRANIREMRKLKDNYGRYLWQDAVAPGQPATFHGYPVLENNHLAESKIYFGDFKKAYWLGDRKQMTVKVSQDTETAFTKDETAIRVVVRLAGTVVLPAALRRLKNIP